MRISEVELDHALAEALVSSRALQQWLLEGGRFARHARTALLLSDEQGSARKAKHWWKHWWTRLPDGSESETDIFAVFQTEHGDRFALHIENKPSDGKLTLKQAADYRRRATFMANTQRYLGYTDFETILVAPISFISRHEECTRQFDRMVTYEAVAGMVPLFGDTLSPYTAITTKPANAGQE